MLSCIKISNNDPAIPYLMFIDDFMLFRSKQGSDKECQDYFTGLLRCLRTAGQFS